MPTACARYKCAACGKRTSVTAGALFDRRRTPLTVWFTACWMFAAQKDGVSALSLQRSLEIGSYQTAWAMLHRLRSVLVRPGPGPAVRHRRGGRDVRRARPARPIRPAAAPLGHVIALACHARLPRTLTGGTDPEARPALKVKPAHGRSGSPRTGEMPLPGC
jgi:hypothetical protein